jgi:hypothetical protein
MPQDSIDSLNVAVLGQFLGPLSGPFRQVAFSEGLESPGQALPQEIFVAAATLFAKDLGIVALQVGHRHFVQQGDLAFQVRRRHGSPFGSQNPLTTRT